MTGLYKIKDQNLEPILITGALGNVGSEIIRQSLEQGYPIRAADITFLL